MIKQKIFILLFIIAIPCFLKAQAPKPYIDFKIQSFRDDKKVILRWAFEDADQWHYVNTLGVNIERAEGASNQFKKINKSIIKPISDKETFLKLDTNSNTYKGMLFTFKSAGDPAPKDLEYQQYAMYYLTTSYEIEAAVLTGSGFIDHTAEKGKKYTYRITVANTKVPQKNNSIVVSEINTELPKISQFSAVFSNRSVNLSWNIEDVKDHYFASIIERSTDSIHFEAVGKPVIKVSTPDDKPEDLYIVSVTDSIPNRIKYYYRVRGLNTFGELGLSSEIISGKAYPDLNVAPYITSVDSSAPNMLTVEWELADSLYDAIEKYEIYHSKKFDTNYIKITELFGAHHNKKEFSFKTKDLSNYFIIKAIGNRYGQATTSAPYFYQIIDSIPPAIPTGLTGAIDTNGVVTLKWNANAEEDLLGYRVLRVLKKDDEYVSMNATPNTATTFKDTLPLNQLNTLVYYKVVALDNKYNESDASNFIELRRPDKIAPAPPRIEKAFAKDNTIIVDWIQSFSDDVEFYLVNRLSSADTSKQWKTIAQVSKNDTTYTDTDVKPNINYTYNIQAIDYGNLKSTPSFTYSASIVRNTESLRKTLKNINAFVSRQYKYIELNWQLSEPEAEEIWIYKAIAGSDEIALMANLKINQNKYIDEDIAPNTKYAYYFKVVYKDGSASKFEKLEVEY
ncbi:MAG: hypothetical protein KGZ59_12660 [Chitinophagaceae bacterium]|nr:hypothetical protein [Chitinophagaceae bacterium]